MQEPKTIRLELSADNRIFENRYHTVLDLPAKDYEIHDALQKIRAEDLPGHAVFISVLACHILPELMDMRLDAPTLEELNFLSARLGMLDENQQWILRAVAKRTLHPEKEDPVRMKELINMTYDLDSVPAIPNVSTDGQLGRFVIANDMDKDVMAVPEQSLYLLDQQKIGRLQREADGGMFIGPWYIAAGWYKMPEIYDGQHLPGPVSEESYVFSLLISEAPEHGTEKTADSAEWIRLPMDRAEADRIAGLHKERCIEDCGYLGFASCVPQITEDLFDGMHDFNQLNTLAEYVAVMFPEEQVKFKAALAAERPGDLAGVLDLAEHLSEYELSRVPENYGQFFMEYLRHHPKSRDGGLPDMLPVRDGGRKLLERLGASVTDYGVISARGCSLYGPGPFEDVQNEEETMQMGGMAMRVKEISTDELRGMKDREGLVLQGCGGSLEEWVDGVNGMLTESGILLEGTKFQAENCCSFEQDGLTCLLFPFSDEVKLDIGRLAIWRLQTHGAFCGTWLSDYVPNRLGGFMEGKTESEERNQNFEKPDCPLIGQDGNIFRLMGIASRTLRQNGMAEQAAEMCDRIHASGSYGEALNILGEYVNITSMDDRDEEEGMEMQL